MITDNDVFKALSKSGIPGTKHAWPEGGAPALPWFTYELTDDGLVAADNCNYSHLPVYRASLYEEYPDADVESDFEDVMADEFGPFTREEYFIEDENAYMTTYTFSYSGGSNG